MSVDKQAGFTLLELLVVLVIIAMSASYAGPDLWRSYEKASERSSVQEFAESVAQLRQSAFHQGRTVQLPAVNEAQSLPGGEMPSLPDGWGLEKSTPLRLLPSGVTNGGYFYLLSPVGNRWQLVFAPLDGRVTIHRVRALPAELR